VTLTDLRKPRAVKGCEGCSSGSGDGLQLWRHCRSGGIDRLLRHEGQQVRGHQVNAGIHHVTSGGALGTEDACWTVCSRVRSPLLICKSSNHFCL